MMKRLKACLGVAAVAAMVVVPAQTGMAYAGSPAESRVTVVSESAGPDRHYGIQNYTAYRMLNRTLYSNSFTNSSQTLATCQSVGGTCTISRALSATRTIGLTLGASRSWASAQLNISAASTQTVTAACTSPTLRSGQTWRAYPHGQRWSYRIQSQYYGNDGGVDFPIGSPQTSGTLYAFNPTGVSCRVT